MKDTTNNPAIITHRLPHEVLVYVKRHYPGANIFDMTEDIDRRGNLKYYDVDVVDEDNTYFLRFDKKGHFVHEEVQVGKIDAEERNPNLPETKEPSVNDEVLEEY